MTTITEEYVTTMAKLIEARNAMKALHAEDWAQRFEDYRAVIQACAVKEGRSELSAAIHLAKEVSNGGMRHVAVMFLAVGAELASTPKQP